MINFKFASRGRFVERQELIDADNNLISNLLKILSHYNVRIINNGASLRERDGSKKLISTQQEFDYLILSRSG